MKKSTGEKIRDIWAKETRGEKLTLEEERLIAAFDHLGGDDHPGMRWENPQ
ncbi:MAG: hypothetical protein OXG44_12685 [Gammaproteobacteria bacterium]|nr:hypothetical protein [Gammaproteobacteria bacterium]